MSFVSKVTISGLLMLLLLVGGGAFGIHQDQDPNDSKPEAKPAAAKDLTARIDQLESRMRKLEEIVFASNAISVYDAERLVADAERRLKDSRRLLSRGYITQSQYEQDQFAVEIARKELELARAESDGRALATRIDVRQAERNVTLAEENLEYTQKLADRGFVPKSAVESVRQDVVRAKRKLDLAKRKLELSDDLLKKNSKK